MQLYQNWLGTRVGHFVLDMVPYYLYGDGPEDPLSIFERIFVDLYYEAPEITLIRIFMEWRGVKCTEKL